MGHRLSKIVTRTGDAGTTGLSDGSRAAKNIKRFEAIGTIDELNSQIGFAQSLISSNLQKDTVKNILRLIQHDLFDLGGALSSPGAELMSERHVNRIEGSVESLNASLPPLKEFILPTGSQPVAALHIARCVCRRAERRLLTVLEIDPQPGTFGLAYLNRLSDLLFVAARTITKLEGTAEDYWESNKSCS